MEHEIGDALGVDRAQRSLCNPLPEHPAEQIDDAPLLLAGEGVGDRLQTHLRVARQSQTQHRVARIGGAGHLDDAADLLARAVAGVEHALGLADEILGILLQQTPVEILHVPEVRVEGGARAARLAGHLVHRGLARAEAQEASPRRPENGVAGALAGRFRLALGVLAHDRSN
jgi:hypothetical protein